MTTPPSHTDISTLDRSIARAHRLVSGLMIATAAIYVVWFWLIQAGSLSENSSSWGEFGDFVGGILNPLVAYSAFYWLTQSVRLQKVELQETRAALEASAIAQQDQALHARTSVRLAALTAIINSISAEVQTQHLQLQFLIDQISRNQGGGRLLDGKWLKLDELLGHIATINQQISERMTQRNAYEEEIRSLIEAAKKVTS